MARFSANYRGGKTNLSCTLCSNGHFDGQKESFLCDTITSKIHIDCDYESIYDPTSPELPRLAKNLSKIDKLRSDESINS